MSAKPTRSYGELRDERELEDLRAQIKTWADAGMTETEWDDSNLDELLPRLAARQRNQR